MSQIPQLQQNCLSKLNNKIQPLTKAYEVIQTYLTTCDTMGCVKEAYKEGATAQGLFDFFKNTLEKEEFINAIYLLFAYAKKFGVPSNDDPLWAKDLNATQLYRHFIVNIEAFKEDSETILKILLEFLNPYQTWQVTLPGQQAVKMNAFEYAIYCKKYALAQQIADNFGSFFAVVTWDESKTLQDHPYLQKLEMNEKIFLIPNYKALAKAIEKLEPAERPEQIKKFEKNMGFIQKSARGKSAEHPLRKYFLSACSLADVSLFYENFEGDWTKSYIEKVLQSNNLPLNQNVCLNEPNPEEEKERLTNEILFSFLSYDEIDDYSRFNNALFMLNKCKINKDNLDANTKIFNNINKLIISNFEYFYQEMLKHDINTKADVLFIFLLCEYLLNQQNKAEDKIIALLSKLGTAKDAMWQLCYVYAKMEKIGQMDACRMLKSSIQFLLAHDVDPEESYRGNYNAQHYAQKIKNDLYVLKDKLTCNQFPPLKLKIEDKRAIPGMLGLPIIATIFLIGSILLFSPPTHIIAGIFMAIAPCAIILLFLLGGALFYGMQFFNFLRTKQDIQRLSSNFSVDTNKKSAFFQEKFSILLKPLKEYKQSLAKITQAYQSENDFLDDVLEPIWAVNQILVGVTNIFFSPLTYRRCSLQQAALQAMTGAISILIGITRLVFSLPVFLVKFPVRACLAMMTCSYSNKVVTNAQQALGAQKADDNEESALLSHQGGKSSADHLTTIKNLQNVDKSLKANQAIQPITEEQKQKRRLVKDVLFYKPVKNDTLAENDAEIIRDFYAAIK